MLLSILEQMFMSDNVYLTKMTQAIAKAHFKDFAFDRAVFLDGQPVHQFEYSDDWLISYLERHKNCEQLAIMLQDKPVGEILFKHIDNTNRTAVFSIHLQNDLVKEKGYGTQAEKLAIEYAFHTLKLIVLYADVIKTNTRSIRVLEKVGFQKLNEDKDFIYYEIRNPNEEMDT